MDRLIQWLEADVLNLHDFTWEAIQNIEFQRFSDEDRSEMLRNINKAAVLILKVKNKLDRDA